LLLFTRVIRFAICYNFAAFAVSATLIGLCTIIATVMCFSYKICINFGLLLYSKFKFYKVDKSVQLQIGCITNCCSKKWSQQKVVGEDTDHGRASVGVLTDRNQERQFGMHPYK